MTDTLSRCRGNCYALSALKHKRASIASDIVAAERKLRDLTDSLVHVDATLLLLDPEANPEAIPNKGPVRRNKLFRQENWGGWVTLSQMILKAELKRKGIGYRELAERLTAMGTPEEHRQQDQPSGIHSGGLPAMPKRDWSSYFATTGWGVAFILAVILGCVLFSGVVAVGPSTQQRLSQKAEQGKAAAQPKSDTAKDPQPRAVAKKDQQSAAKEPECAKKDEAAYNDCLINLRTTRATELQAYWGKISAHVAVGALAFAAIAATAALWTVKPSHVLFSGRIPMSLHFSVANHGQTPAYGLEVFNAFLFLPYPLPKSYDPGMPTDGQPTNVLPTGATLPCSRPLGQPLGWLKENQLRAGTHRYYIFVVVRYRDIFRPIFFRRKIRTSRMCASLPGNQMLAGMTSPQGAVIECAWDIDPEHNDAD